jgi:CHAD domain-containing protein
MVARPTLLQLPAAEAARRIALGYLDAARAARTRLDDPADVEALHDFRVALRRLRSCLRSYRGVLKGVPKKLRRELRRLARATNEARDAEVQLAWLARQGDFAAGERAGVQWWRHRLQRAQRGAYDAVRAEVTAEFSHAEHHLRAVLRPVNQGAAPFAGVAVKRLQRSLRELAASLASIRSEADAVAIHATRIAGKRLRYLLEPLADGTEGKEAVAALKQFQDRLGEFCDGSVRAREIAQAVEAAGGELARRELEQVLGNVVRAPKFAAPLPGLFALAQRAHDDVRRCYAEIERLYLGGRGARLLGQLMQVAAGLAPPARRPARVSPRPIAVLRPARRRRAGG